MHSLRLEAACDLTCDASGEGDLGFILSKDAWGMGDATEAARAMFRYEIVHTP